MNGKFVRKKKKIESIFSYKRDFRIISSVLYINNKFNVTPRHKTLNPPFESKFEKKKKNKKQNSEPICRNITIVTVTKNRVHRYDIYILYGSFVFFIVIFFFCFKFYL